MRHRTKAAQQDTRKRHATRLQLEVCAPFPRITAHVGGERSNSEEALRYLASSPRCAPAGNASARPTSRQLHVELSYSTLLPRLRATFHTPVCPPRVSARTRSQLALAIRRAAGVQSLLTPWRRLQTWKRLCRWGIPRCVAQSRETNASGDACTHGVNHKQRTSTTPCVATWMPRHACFAALDGQQARECYDVPIRKALVMRARYVGRNRLHTTIPDQHACALVTV